MRGQVRRRINAIDLNDDLKEQLRVRADLVEMRIDDALRGTHFYGAQLGWRTYVIRNDHLDMIAVIAPVANVLTVSLGASAVATLILSVVGFFVKVRAKGAEVDPKEYGVLTLLRAHQPITSANLLPIVDEARIQGHGAWSLEQLEQTLNDLREVRLKDGTLEAMTVCDSHGRWSCNGV